MEFDSYDYALTLSAEQDLDEILDYISVKLLNPDAASGFVNALESKIEEICMTPQIGSIVDNDFIKRNDVRLAHVKNYLIYYIVDELKKSIVILRIVLNRRNQEDIIKEL